MVCVGGGGGVESQGCGCSYWVCVSPGVVCGVTVALEGATELAHCETR